MSASEPDVEKGESESQNGADIYAVDSVIISKLLFYLNFFKFSPTMSYKLDLRKSVANLVGQMSSNEIIKMFKDKPISRATIFRVIKDCREGKQPEKKQSPDVHQN